MNSILIEDLYKLVSDSPSKETLLNNLDLFKDFYHDRAIYFCGMRSEPKIFDIFKFLLIYEKGEIFEYAHANICDLFHRYYSNSLFKYYFNDTVVNNESVYQLLRDIREIQELRNIIDNIDYTGMDNMNKADAYKLKSYYLDRDIVSAFILIINKGYFDLDVENIKIIIDFLKNNKWLHALSNGDIELDMMNRDCVYQYVTKFLCVKEFSTNDEIKSDKLINNILYGKIKEKKIFALVLEKLDSYLLMDIYQGDLNRFIRALDNISTDELEKQILFNKFFDKVLSESDYSVLPFVEYYIRNLDSEYFRIYFMNNEKNQFLINAFNIPVQFLSTELIDYYFDNDIYMLNPSLLINLNQLLLNNKIDSMNLSERAKVKLMALNNKKYVKIEKITYEESLSVLKEIFNKKESLSISQLVNISTCLIRQILSDDNYEVYYFLSRQMNGYYDTNSKNISLSISRADDILKSNNYEQRCKLLFSILITIFHECTHAKQWIRIDNNDIDENNIMFLKESLIKANYPNYYKMNYEGVSYEQDARVSSYELCGKFIKNNFPEVYEMFKEYCSSLITREQSINTNIKKIFRDEFNLSLDRIFVRLVVLKPDIINQFDILSTIYNQDGSKKSSASNPVSSNK